MMKVEHITDYEVAHYPQLMERLDVPADTEDVSEYLSDMWHDCDHVKSRGEDGRGNHMFFDVKTADTHFIIHYDDPDAEDVDLINWWLAGADGDLIGRDDNQLENNWNDWDKVKKGVAYRGGSGYCYGLYAKELK